MRTLVLLFAAATLAVASAADSYKVTLFYDSVVDGQELEQGACKVTVEDDGRIVFQQGRKSVEATGKVESVEAPYDRTSVRYTNGDGRHTISEIRFGGTTTKLVFN